MRRIVLAVALSLAGLAASADIGPKPRLWAPGLEVRSGDLEGVNIEMSWEHVSVVLHKASVKPGTPPQMSHQEQLVVDAEFHFRNLGDLVAIEEGFPIGPIQNMTEFSVTVDGKKADFGVSDLAPAPAKGANPLDRRHDYWYLWKATFPSKAESVHKVHYVLDLFHPQWTLVDTKYVLHTGAPWKNRIGKVTVELRFDGINADHLYSVSPLEGVVRDGDTFRWTMTDVEPKEAQDILIQYDSDRSWEEEISDLRAHLADRWACRMNLAKRLAGAAARQGRKEMTEAERAAWLDALDGLLDGKDDGNRTIMPTRDPLQERNYLYGDKAELLFQYMDDALAAAEAKPADPKGREVLARWLHVAQQMQKGKLFAGEEVMTWPKDRAVELAKSLANRIERAKKDLDSK